MFNRIVLIAALTGIGQLFSVFTIKYASKILPNEAMSSIAQIDALIILLINFIGLGLQSAAIRNIATATNWVNEFQETQSARFTLSLFLTFGCVFYFIKPEYIIFFISPLLALSGEYALYALGKPVMGAAIACIRAIIPYSLLISASLLKPEFAIHIFFLSWIAVYLFTNWLIKKILNVKVVLKPSFPLLKRYIQTLPLGIINFSFYFLGIGLILIIPYFYPPIIETPVFLGLKFYMVYKGILRIIHQAFFKEMTSSKWCLMIDQLSILIGLVFMSSVLSFPSSFITLFFGKQYLTDRLFFILLSISGLIYSFSLSNTTKALLEKRDKPYMIVVLTAASVAILLTILLSYLTASSFNIGISLCIGEIILCAGLLRISDVKGLLPARTKFLFFNSLLLIIPFFIKAIFTDNLQWFLISTTVLSALLLFNNFQKIKQFTSI